MRNPWGKGFENQPVSWGKPSGKSHRQSVQIDFKHLKLDGRRFYQFTAIDEATRYRALKIYAHSSIPTGFGAHV